MFFLRNTYCNVGRPNNNLKAGITNDLSPTPTLVEASKIRFCHLGMSRKRSTFCKKNPLPSLSLLKVMGDRPELLDMNRYLLYVGEVENCARGGESGKKTAKSPQNTVCFFSSVVLELSSGVRVFAPTMEQCITVKSVMGVVYYRASIGEGRMFAIPTYIRSIVFYAISQLRFSLKQVDRPTVCTVKWLEVIRIKIVFTI